MRSLVWVGETFNTKYTTTPSFYRNLNSVCTKHKAVIYGPGARQPEENGISTWLYGKLAVRYRVRISFSILSLHFPLSVLSVQFYFHLFLFFFPSFGFLFFCSPPFICHASFLPFFIPFFQPTKFIYFLSLYLFLLFFHLFCLFTHLRLRLIQELKCLSCSHLHELDIRNRVHGTIILC